jgi:predicted glycoside hydrolase/deacetylase ChbG (UPF0249 family)
MSELPVGETNRLLGYPPDARLLLVNADDFGMYQSIDEAVFRSIREGIVRSTSLMVPCPAASDAMRVIVEHPDIPVGVHLSVIRDIDSYHWGPLSPRDRVRSLVDAGGDFHTVPLMGEMLARARREELEAEFRAQIEAALSAGLAPTHLDWHCLRAGGRADVFDMTFGLAREYGLALRVSERQLVERVRSQGFATVDHGTLDSFRLNVEDKSARYAQMLRDLPVGLSEWAVHPGLDDAQARATDPHGWGVRATDFAFLVSPEARKVVKQEGIILIDYGPLQKLWRKGRLY